ncbi:hypothetical protein M6D93_03635 [Jatrophihabitans telluris]|uniref:Uncharacterized protein n=1 Tax=Jatrophihabitans telluris TaxID=2038343 RepID=A0ABY4R1U2_9ACTN|nr:hypothetical protein [Jatrophihabitans telluris]UQX89100.1 hypothetical protein M6D93_03635 [Jatrophihabitans telluris]
MSIDPGLLEMSCRPLITHAHDVEMRAAALRRQIHQVLAHAHDTPWRSPAGQALMSSLEHGLSAARRAADEADGLGAALRHHHDTVLARAQTLRREAEAALHLLAPVAGISLDLARHLA